MKKHLNFLVLLTLAITLISCNDHSQSSNTSSQPQEIEKPLVEFNLPKTYEQMEVASLDNNGVMELFFKAKDEVADEITVLQPADVNNYPQSLKNQIFVSPHGNNNNVGDLANPLKSISQGLHKLEGMGGGVLYLLEGEYVESEELIVNEKHSGTKKSPLFIKAYNQQDVTVTSSHSISRNEFKRINEVNLPSNITKRLTSNAKENALCVNLLTLGFERESFGEITNMTTPIFSVDGEEKTLARYPNLNDEELPITEVVDQGKITYVGSPYYQSNKDKTNGFVIRLNDEFPYTWNEDNIWMRGHLNEQWDVRSYPVSLNSNDKTMSAKKNFSNVTQYEINTKKECTFYLYNALEALDQEGEWYLDKNEGWLVYYPSKDFTSARLLGSNKNLLNINKADNVVVDGLNIFGSGSKGISIVDSETVLIQNCTIENNAGNGIYSYHSRETGAIYSNFSNNNTSIYMATKTLADTTSTNPIINLTPEHNFIQNCRFTNGKETHIRITSIGSVVSHNYLIDGQLMVDGCVECFIEYNEILHGKPNVEDAGFIYVNGASQYWTYAGGNHVRYNYLHDFVAENSHAGIYLDDRRSGEYVYGNICDVRCDGKGAIFGGKTSYRHHNGNRNVFFNNISIGATRRAFYDCEYLDAGHGNWKAFCDKMLKEIDVYLNSEIFCKRYPLWLEYWQKVKSSVEQGDGNDYLLYTPSYNVYQNNIIVDTPLPFDMGKEASKNQTNIIKDNLVRETLSSTFDKDYSLDINVYSKIVDWEYEYEDVPYEKMGLSKK